jgi:hypothetical protein
MTDRRGPIKRLLASLLLIALLLGAAACSDSAGPSGPRVLWTGQALEGVKYAQRDFAGSTVHYPVTTDPREVEGLEAAAAYLDGRAIVDKVDRLHLWVVPSGASWPAGLPALPPGRQARAVAPGTVVIREEALPTAMSEGLPESLAVAITQGPQSPAFVADWLHEGTGQLLTGSLEQFPGAPYRAARSALGAEVTGPQLLAYLTQAPDTEEALKSWRAAALSLATLVMDRYGVRWSDHFVPPSRELPPAQAARWATGGRDEAEALALWAERLHYVGAARADGPFIPSMADISPVRLEAPPVRGGGDGPRANYSPHRYAIDARYEPEQRTVTGTVKLAWQNGEQVALDTLYFNLWPNAEQYATFGGAIAIDRVAVDGKAVAYQAANLDLTVPLGRTVGHGEQVEVEIAFTTTLPFRVTGRVFGQESTGLFNLAHWYPILAVLDERGWNLHAMPTFPGEPYSETSSYTVRLDVPAGIRMAATGHPTGKADQGDRTVYTWEAPSVRDWVAVGGRNLVEEVRQAGAVTVRVMDPNTVVAGQIADETVAALKLLQPQFGPYPYEDLVVVPCCAGLEYPGLFYTAGPSSENWWHTVLFHELAHQWFYGVVGNDQYGEAWLDEGFARYGERFGNRTAGYTDQLRDLKRNAMPPGTHVNSSSSAFTVTGGYGTGVYDRGALVLEDLEALVGPEVFRRLLQEWVAHYRFQTATTLDFVRLAEEVSGQDLAAFFAAHKVDPSLREGYRPILPLGKVKP